MATDEPRVTRARLRWLLVLIVILAIAPVFALYLLRLQSSSHAALEHARERAVSIARDGANAHAQVAQQAQRFLEVLGQVPAVRTAALPECETFLRWVLQGRHWLTGIFVVSPSGKGVCGANEVVRTLDISDRGYFRAALATRGFVQSDVIVSRVTGTPIVAAALPLYGADGQLQVVIGVGLDLPWISQTAAEAKSRFDGILIALDRNGRVVSYQPSAAAGAWKIGQVVDSPLVHRILEASSATFETEDPSGEQRIFGIAKLENTGVTIAVGLKRGEVLDPIERAFYSDLIFLLLVTAASVGAALLVAEFGLLRGVRTLKSAALRLKAGKMGLRVKLSPFVAAELHDLAATYNAMTAEFERLAYLDRLTGLPNRRYLERSLSGRHGGATNCDGPRAVLAIDLDGFKPVNDNYGHAIGDKVLALIARRIASVVDERGMLARVGGDEFVAIIPLAEGQGREVARAVAEEIRKAMEQPIELDGFSFPVACSVGVALVPEDAKSLAGALVVADAALYEAKRAGRNRVIDTAPPLAPAEANERAPHWTRLEVSAPW